MFSAFFKLFFASLNKSQYVKVNNPTTFSIVFIQFILVIDMRDVCSLQVVFIRRFLYLLYHKFALVTRLNYATSPAIQNSQQRVEHAFTLNPK